MSEALPTCSGRTTCTGFAGYSCAIARRGIAHNAASDAASAFMSIRPNAGFLDQLRVLLELARDHPLELRNGHHQRVRAELADAPADLLGLHERVDLLRQALDDGTRRLGRHQRADPEVVAGVRIARLLHGRQA